MTAAAGRPLYARVLRLHHVRLSGLASVALFEGVIAVAVLLALAEVTSWWAVPVLPLAVAAMVKLNDVLSGLLRSASAAGDGAPLELETAGSKAGGAKHRLPAAEPARAAVAPADMPLRPAARAVGHVSRGVVDFADPADSPPQQVRQPAHRRYR